MSWNEAKVETVRVMWADGFSAGQIARALGDGTSRNAVIGIIHRRGFSNGRPQRTHSNKQAFAVKKRFVAQAEDAPVAVTLPDPIPGVTIETVRDGQCRWPYGHANEPGFHLCGHPCGLHRPYCLAHDRVAWSGHQSYRQRERSEWDEIRRNEAELQRVG